MLSVIKINSKCKSKAINMSISSNSAGGEHTIRGRAYKQDVEPANHGTRLGLTASHWSAPLGHSPDWFIKKSDFLPNLVGVSGAKTARLPHYNIVEAMVRHSPRPSLPLTYAHRVRTLTYTQPRPRYSHRFREFVTLLFA